MTDEDINKFLHEKIMGECWHDKPVRAAYTGVNIVVCPKCDKRFSILTKNHHPSYATSWADYGKLLEKVRQHADWEYFVEKLFCYQWLKDGNFATCTHEAVGILFDPVTGSAAIAEYFGRESK